MNALNQVLELAGGPIALTRAINKRIEKPVTYQAVLKWVRQGHLPRTEWTGETQYAKAMSKAVGGRIKVRDLLQKPGQKVGANTATSNASCAQAATETVAAGVANV